MSRKKKMATRMRARMAMRGRVMIRAEGGEAVMVIKKLSPREKRK